VVVVGAPRGVFKRSFVTVTANTEANRESNDAIRQRNFEVFSLLGATKRIEIYYSVLS
jgi:hypothetical protein